MTGDEPAPNTGAAAKKLDLFHEQNLFEPIDEIEGIKHQEFARLKKNTDNK